MMFRPLSPSLNPHHPGKQLNLNADCESLWLLQLCKDGGVGLQQRGPWLEQKIHRACEGVLQPQAHGFELVDVVGVLEKPVSEAEAAGARGG